MVLLRPGWLGRHVLVLGALIGFVLLGRWQWGVAQASRGSLQNLFYAVQWWVFCVVGVVAWFRVCRAEVLSRRGIAPPAVPAEPVTPLVLAVPRAGSAKDPAGKPPGSRAGDPAGKQAGEDAEVAAYNAYLAYLADHPRR